VVAPSGPVVMEATARPRHDVVRVEREGGAAERGCGEERARLRGSGGGVESGDREGG
jgi:hypothetical protein